MVRFLIYFVLLILLTIFLWGNMEHKASLTLMGEPVFRDVPVLIIILGSMLAGMVIMLPFLYTSRLRLSRKLKARQKNEAKPDVAVSKEKAAAAFTTPEKGVPDSGQGGG